MNIAKQRRILALREEARSLVHEYENKKSLALEIQTPKLLDVATNDFITFIRDQGFTVSADQQGMITADSGDGILITLHRNPGMIAVSMPNHEYYEVSIESTMEEPLSVEGIDGLNQDRQISEYNVVIDKTRRQISLIDSSLFRYCLYIQPRDGHPGGKKVYMKFSEVLRVMFS